MHRRRLWLLLAIAALWGAAAPAAAARDPKNVVQALSGRGSVDWTRGVVLSVGAASADLRAPSPTIARIRAERIARDRARAKLAEQARGLTYADGATVGEHLDGDEAAAARFERSLDRAADEAVDYGSDGSVVVTLALPIEAVRAAVDGASAPPGASEPTAVVIDGRKLLDRPRVGVRVGDYAGPVVYHRSARTATRDPRAGGKVVRLSATGFAGGVVSVDGDGAWARSNPLVILVVGTR